MNFDGFIMKLILIAVISLLLLVPVSAQTINWDTKITTTAPAKQEVQRPRTVRGLPGVSSDPIKDRKEASDCTPKTDKNGVKQARSVECANVPVSIFDQ